MVALWIILLLAALGWALWLRGQLTAAREELQQCCAEQGEASERQLQHQHALLDNMVEGVMVLDEEGRVELTNASLRTLLGWDEAVQGRALTELMKVPELEALVAEAREAGELHDGELELPGADDEPPLRLLVNAHRLGAGARTILVFHNVTRLKELENTRRDFVANVSHELRTPLSLIKGFTETLMDKDFDQPEQARDFLQKIDKHTDRLGYLIDDLLTLAQLDSGQLAMNRQPTDLRVLAERVEEDLRSKAAKRSIQLQTDIPAKLLLDADGDRLQQAVFNLVDNAIKYGGENKDVRVSCSTSSNAQLEIAVQDQGPGIPPEATERIFERFFRVDRARSREQGGTGLGLSIVKHIIQSHGGEVWARNAKEGGAAFHLTLPCKKDVASNQETLPFDETAGH